nr:MAG TPA: DNA binding protein [Microviridae sp.]
MISRMYVVYDQAVKAFVTPHFCRSHGEAERNFKSAVNDPKTGHLHSSPEQFTLFYVADFDESTGLVSSLSAPQSVVSAIQCKESQELRAV